MASKSFNNAKHEFLEWLATQDVRACLVTAEPDADLDFVAGLTEHPDGVRVTAANVAATEDDANDRASITCDPLVFSGVTDTTPIVGIVFFVQVTDDSDSWLLEFHDTADITPDGTDITFTPGSGGIARMV